MELVDDTQMFAEAIEKRGYVAGAKDKADDRQQSKSVSSSTKRTK